MEKATNEVLRQQLRGTQSEMEELLPTLHPRSFSEYLSALSEEKGMSKAEVIHQSGIPRTYAYQLYQGTRRPSRDKVLILAIVLGCTIEECDRLLTLAAHQHLYAKDPRDALILFSIHHHDTLEQVEERLNEYGMALLRNYE